LRLRQQPLERGCFVRDAAMQSLFQQHGVRERAQALASIFADDSKALSFRLASSWLVARSAPWARPRFPIQRWRGEARSRRSGTS
jgi:hypothetical protein